MTEARRKPTATGPLPSRLIRNRRGSIAAEFALVIPLLLLLSFGIIEFGRAMWIRNLMQSAVEDAARCYALNRPACDSPAKVQAYAVGAAGGIPVTTASFEAGRVACGARVRATYSFNSIVPVIPLNGIDLKATACRPAPP